MLSKSARTSGTTPRGRASAPPRKRSSRQGKKSNRGDSAQLLGSRSEPRGLQPAGAPARPREERRKRLTPAFGEMGRLCLQLPNLGVIGVCTEVVIILQKEHRNKVSNQQSQVKVLTRLLNSQPETWGLHRVGALARPHGKKQRRTLKVEAKDGLPGWRCETPSRPRCSA